jgi:F-type H+-transporting ATPase subunit b
MPSQAAVDVERLRETAAKDLEVEQARAIAQLRQQVVALAIQRVEGQLVDRLDAVAQQQLIDRSIAMLGGKA